MTSIVAGAGTAPGSDKSGPAVRIVSKSYRLVCQSLCSEEWKTISVKSGTDELMDSSGIGPGSPLFEPDGESEANVSRHRGRPPPRRVQKPGANRERGQHSLSNRYVKILRYQIRVRTTHGLPII